MLNEIDLSGSIQSDLKANVSIELNDSFKVHDSELGLIETNGLMLEDTISFSFTKSLVDEVGTSETMNIQLIGYVTTESGDPFADILSLIISF